MRYTVSAVVGVSLLFVATAIPLSASRYGQKSFIGTRNLLPESPVTESALHTGQRQEIDNPSRYFASAMIMQSSEGMAFARNVARFSSDSELAEIAARIGLSQKAYLDEMQQWEKMSRKTAHQLNPASAQSFARLMEEVKRTTREDVEDGLAAKKPEDSFIAIAMAHRQGTIDMAKVFLIFEGDKEMSRIANAIIGEEQGHIRSMQSWLAKTGSGPAYRY